MFFQSIFRRCMHASEANREHFVVCSNYDRLVDNKYWDCSTPSKALLVLGVLVRSGTVIDKLDKAASGTLCAMAPSMTLNEQTILQKWSSFLRLKSVATPHTSTFFDVSESFLPKDDANRNVLRLYSFFVRNPQMKSSTDATPAVFLVSSVLQLNAITSLMLLEMTLSALFQPDAAWRNKEVAAALLTRLRYHVMFNEDIGFRAVWWLLDVFDDTQSFLHKLPLEGGCLFRACIQRLHVLLPRLSAGDCLLVFPLLKNMVYGTTFIIRADIIKRLIACELEEFSHVRTSLVIRTLSCENLVSLLRGKLYRVLCMGYRMSDIGKNDCLLLLSTIVTALRMDETKKSGGHNADDFFICELLFAQIYVVSKDMSAVECVKALEYMELITLYNPTLPPSSNLLERLKKRTLFETRRYLRQLKTVPADVELLLETLHRLERLLRRCVLLPFLYKDRLAVNELYEKLTHKLQRAS